MNFLPCQRERGNMFRYFRGKKEGSEEEREGKVRDQRDVLAAKHFKLPANHSSLVSSKQSNSEDEFFTKYFRMKES